MRYLSLADRLMMAAGFDPSIPPKDHAEALIRKLVSRFDVPVMALHVPAASLTQEVGAEIKTTDEASTRVKMTFPGKCLIVGFLPTIIPTTKGAFAVTTSDVEVLIDVDGQSNRRTRSDGLNTGAAAGFVTLASIGIDKRLYMLHLDSDSPEVGFTFRSKYTTAGASNLGGNAKIFVAAYVAPVAF